MKLIKNLFHKFNVTKNIKLDDQERFVFHKKILENKKILKSCYSEFYEKILFYEKKFKTKTNDQIRIELGSGIGFIKKIDKNIITSDVVYNKFTDKIIDANNIPYKKNSIDSIFGIFCFHHFKNHLDFLKDIERKLKVGGLCILIEPYYGPLASIVYKNVHSSEYFNKSEKFGHKPKNKNSMYKANQALSYIYFVREREKISKMFPKLKIVHMSIFNNYLRYFFSGGLNFKKLLPDFLLFFVRCLEFILYPFIKLFGIHYIIVIKKLK